MRQSNYICGFWDRVEAVILKSGCSRAELANRMGRHRHTLYRREGGGMDALTLARFCAVTQTDANWLLGIGRRSA